MSELESLQEQIARAEEVLAEARENYQQDPTSYSAQLLLLSIENHLADLYKKRDTLGL